MTPTELELLRDVLGCLHEGDGLFPEVHPFRIKHEPHRKLIDGLLAQVFLQIATQRYQLTMKGLRACDNELAKQELERCDRLIPILKDLYRKDPGKAWSAGDVKPFLASQKISPKQYLVSITFLGTWISPSALLANEYENGFTSRIRVADPILDIGSLGWESLGTTFNFSGSAVFSVKAHVIPGRQLKKAQLSSLKLRGFKSIRHLEELSLSRLNVLIGANGAGKSNFISFFRFLGAMFEVPGEVQLYTAKAGGANTFLFDQAQTTPQLEAELSFTSEQGTYEYRHILAATATDSFIFADERYRAYLQEPGGWQHAADIGSKETGLYDAFTKGDSTAKAIFWLMREFAVYQFHNTSETARIKQRWSTGDNKRLKSDGGNLAPFLLRIKTEHPRVYERITGTLRLMVPFFADFVLENSSQNILLQ